MKLLLRRTLVRSVRYSAFSVLLACLFNFSYSRTDKPALKPEKDITVNVNAAGIITVGRDTIKTDELAAYISQRLFKSYTSTGLMYDAIKLSITGEPKAELVEKVKKEIENGLKKTLTDVCLEEHKKLYADLDAKQQEKLKKKFPVLFQSSFD